jgi:phosphoribosyl 1,2-cyclic phosphodiesterase
MKKEGLRVVILGSGSSVSLPVLSCFSSDCRCCTLARSDPHNKNRRLNTSVLIQSGSNNILVDCGKTFYNSALNFLVPLQITSLTAVVLTHGHADAILGLDDLRHYTREKIVHSSPLEIFCDDATMRVVEMVFSYLVDPRTAVGSGLVADIKFIPCIKPFEPLNPGNVEFIAVPVEHGVYPDGRPYMSNGFIIAKRILYISDVSFIPEPTFKYLHEYFNERELELLILDCSEPLISADLISHIAWPQCQDIVARLKPLRTLLVGISHKIEHENFNQTLPDSVSLAFDGLIVDLS